MNKNWPTIENPLTDPKCRWTPALGLTFTVSIIIIFIFSVTTYLLMDTQLPKLSTKLLRLSQAYGRLSQEEHKFEPSLGNLAQSYTKKLKKTRTDSVMMLLREKGPAFNSAEIWVW